MRIAKMRHKIGRALSLIVLFGTGAVGPYNDALGVAAGVALALRHRASVWLAACWGVAITYVSSLAAIAYAGPVRGAAIAAILLGSMSGLGACRQLYSGPPVVADRNVDRLSTKRVRAKREPDRLIAEDLSVCFVIPEVYASVQPGAAWRCAWRHVPEGQ